DWIEFASIDEKSPIEVNGATIRPIPNSHLKNEINEKYISENGLTNRMECYSYLIEVDGKKVLYSADLGSEKDLFNHLAGIDFLVVESMHIDVGSLFEAVKENNVRRVVLTHLDENFDTHEVFTQAEKAGVKNLFFGSDGLRLEF
ncbi:MAG: MBL fold metallo-hydrolase, partial [FCB group bacterium]|nr:MBL fold metallo-hydrolase [FCB group bacterium]